MKLHTPLFMPLVALALSACSSAPAESRDDAKADVVEETVEATPAADALGPISLYFGDRLISSVDADGRFLAGEDATTPGRHVATFTPDGTITFVDSPDMKMTLSEDGTITMFTSPEQSQAVPITIDGEGVISISEGQLSNKQMRFDADGRLTSTSSLPDGFDGARIDGLSKVPARHAAYAFVVTTMFTANPEPSPGPTEQPAEEPAEEP